MLNMCRKRLEKYIRTIKNNYRESYSAFCMYERIRELQAANVVGENRAQNNLELLNIYSQFFKTCKRSLHFYFLSKLAKIFDYHIDSIHFNKVINYCESNDIKNIENNDLSNIKNRLEDKKEILEKLKKHRDQTLAHEDKNKDNINLPVGEIRDLFNIIEELLNIFSYKLSSSHVSYKKTIEKRSRQDVDKIIKDLQSFNQL